MERLGNIGVVIIGRNEGVRLVSCIDSVLPFGCDTVYVDSDSSDDSVSNAQQKGAHVINLDMSKPFSAARARNTGWKHLVAVNPNIEFIQFVDGDCELQPNWLPTAERFLQNNSEFAVVCGRRRERYPEASIYNQFCDEEWNTPIGETLACGGDALIRTKALTDVDGYNDGFIAGEEPEMCFRMRQQNWKIFRIDEEMTLHDANILKFSQWWKRSKRAGFAYALGAFEHGNSPERFYVKPSLRALFWSSLMALIVILIIFYPLVGIALIAVFPLQIIRVYLKQEKKGRLGWLSATFLSLGKIPETFGIFQFVSKTLFKSKFKIIEYK